MTCPACGRCQSCGTLVEDGDHHSREAKGHLRAKQREAAEWNRKNKEAHHARRAARAYDLRACGATYRKIGTELEVSACRARDIARKEWRRLGNPGQVAFGYGFVGGRRRR